MKKPANTCEIAQIDMRRVSLTQRHAWTHCAHTKSTNAHRHIQKHTHNTQLHTCAHTLTHTHT